MGIFRLIAFDDLEEVIDDPIQIAVFVTDLPVGEFIGLLVMIDIGSEGDLITQGLIRIIVFDWGGGEGDGEIQGLIHRLQTDGPFEGGVIGDRGIQGEVDLRKA